MRDCFDQTTRHFAPQGLSKTWQSVTRNNSEYTNNHPKIVRDCREPNGQASGGDDAADKWIFNTIKEKDLRNMQNGAPQPAELERNEVRPYTS